MTDKRQADIAALPFVCASIFTGLVCWLLSFINDELDTQFIINHFVPTIDNFVAENSEKFQFVFGTITFVVAYFLTGSLENKARPKALANEKQNGYIYLLIYTLIIYLAVYTFSKNAVFLDNFPETLKKVFKISVLFAIAFFGVREFIVVKEDLKKRIRTALPFAHWVLVIIGLVSVAVISSFYLRETYFYGEGNVEHHTDAYFYPIWKVWSGQYPLVDFTSLYGYYPYFFVGVMALFGGVSLKKFSVIIAFLIATVFICIFYVLWSVCKRKTVALMGLLSVEYILIMYNTELSGSYYLQYLPHRMITLCLILAISCLYAKQGDKKGKKARCIEVLGWICSGAALLWNLDTGIVVWLGWAIYLCFIHIIENSLFKGKTWLFFLKTIGKCIITGAASFSALLLLTGLLSGTFVGFGELFWGQSVFYGSGFFMIKMKLYHPWMVLLLIYAVGIAVALSGTKDLRKNTELDIPKTLMIFMTAVCGVGAFIYYQGRSHDFVFVVVVWPALMLFAFFLDGLITRMKNADNATDAVNRCISVGLAAILITFSLGWFHNIYSDRYLVNFKNKVSIGPSGLQEEIDIVSKTGIQPENVELLTAYAAEVYEYFGIRYMPKVQAQVDVFSWTDVEEIQLLLETTSKDVIISNKTRNYLTAHNEQRFKTVIENRFIFEEKGNFLICRQK